MSLTPVDPTALTPLSAASYLRTAKRQLEKDIAILLEAFAADTGLAVNGIGTCHSPGPSTDRPLRFTVAVALDL